MVMFGELMLDVVLNIVLSLINVKNIVLVVIMLNVISSNMLGGSGYDGNGSGNLNVSDFWGNYVGWMLIVGMGLFSLGVVKVDLVILNLNMIKGNVDNVNIVVLIVLSLN